MIELAVRLATAGRARVAILAIMTLAVSIGSVVLMVTLGLAPAFQTRADRTAWTNASFSPVVIDPDSPVIHTRMATSIDFFHGERIDVVALLGIGTNPPLPPTFRELPAEGTTVVSPALAELMRSQPMLRQRYGEVTGLIDAGALAGPDQLLAVRGMAMEEAVVSALPVVKFADHAPRLLPSGKVQQVSTTVRLLILLGGVAFVVPLFLFIVMATRLSAASRTQLFAILRLAGASTGQTHLLAAVETLIASFGGVMLGLGLFFVVRPAAAYLSPDGRLFPSDVSPGVLGAGGVAILVPLIALISSQAALADVARSPFETSRQAISHRVSGWRLLPLAAAIAFLGYVLSTEADPSAGAGQSWLVAVAFFLLLVALVYTGPWFARLSGSMMARGGGPARLLAGRRLTADPQRGFRSIASVVLAILITTMFVAITPAAAESLRSTTVFGQHQGAAQATISEAGADGAQRLVAELKQVDGVSAAALVYEGLADSATEPANVWIGDCEAVVASARLTGVPCGSAAVILAEDKLDLMSGSPQVIDIYHLQADEPDASADRLTRTIRPDHPATMPTVAGVDMPGAIVSPAEIGSMLPALRPTLILLRYESDGALEEARTLIMRQSANNHVTTRDNSYATVNAGERNLYRALAIAMLGAFAVGGGALVIAIAVGLLERRRSFALLRITGAPIRALRATLFLEACGPLVLMSAVAAMLGALIGRWTGQPGAEQGSMVEAAGLPLLAGLAISVVVLAVMLPMTRRVTETEETRFD